MARSMTAFARSSVTQKGETWSVEIRSLNHRFFEFSLKIPSVYCELEGKIKDLVHAEIGRGKVSVNVSQSFEAGSTGDIFLDESIIDFYVKNAARLGKKYKLSGTIGVEQVLAFPKVIVSRSPDVDVESAWQKIEKLLRQALKDLLKAKQVEGRELTADIEERIGHIKSAAERVRAAAAGSPERYLVRLRERIRQILGDKEIDDDRILREAALMAERSDVTEELVRLESHLKLFAGKVKLAGEVGRELDFFCQEINREINTIGSKSQYFDISQDVIEMKKELEKIREQVQNIE